MAELAVGLAKSVVEGTLSKAQATIAEEAKLRDSAQCDLVFITGEFQMMQSFLKVANTERVENPPQVLVPLLTPAPGGCWYPHPRSRSRRRRAAAARSGACGGGWTATGSSGRPGRGSGGGGR